MIHKNLADPPAISPEQEARADLDDRSAADDLLIHDIESVIYELTRYDLVNFELDIILHRIYHSSGNDELLAVNDLKSLLFNTALELVKRDK